MPRAPRYAWRQVGAVLLVGAALACGDTPTEPAAGDSVRELLRLPAEFATPAIPEYNPLTPQKIALGRRLFYDPRLSGNQTQTCASCHEQRLAFTDSQATPAGSTGHVLRRNSQGLANTAYFSTLTWGNNVLLELEDQIKVPLLSDNPIELGVLDGNRAEVLQRFDDDSTYRAMFKAAFPNSPPGATINQVIFALASFTRTLISSDSPYDRYYRGDPLALTAQQVRGLKLFNSERLECFHCHSGVNLSTSYRDAGTTAGTVTYPFFNNGLYNIGGDGSYPTGNQGLYELTLNPADRGRFRPQGLRNVAVTAPYMHDGSLATLRDVIRHYARGGRLVDSGPYAGDGSLSPLKSGLVRGFDITEAEIDDVVAFLESLTDEKFLHDPRFADPFAASSPSPSTPR
ncbi:MAG TPA: di-heme enzyme [Gemmatimonadales bacterium]|nr:di-heme enzyme [Gemmatimonadales bacterium]HRZ08303.1 di-heme enzyme [Gemmatimonadales bacterium]